MIRVTYINGCEFHLAATNIASINVTATSSQWHGVRSIVSLFDGGSIECQQEARDIAVQLADHGGIDNFRERCIDIVARHGGSVEIEAAIRAEPALPKPLY